MQKKNNKPAKAAFSSIALAVFFLGSSTNSFCQIWDYDFGNQTGSYTTVGVSNNFLPVPESGSAIVSIASSGDFRLENAGSPLGSLSELQLFGSESEEGSKFALTGYNPGYTSHIKYATRFSNGSEGSFYFFLGSGASFEGSGPIENSEVFTAIVWNFDNGGVISAHLQTGSGVVAFPSGAFVQDQNYRIDIYANNSDASQFYDLNSGQLMAAGTVDIYVNGVLMIEGAEGLGLANMKAIDSWAFYSDFTNPEAMMILDDITYSNDITLKQILPVNFSNVRAMTDAQGKVRIHFENLTEKEISYYLIERSPDGRNFSELKKIAHVNNQGNVASYDVIDHNPSHNMNYYRISAREFSGKIEVANILRVSVAQDDNNIRVYPNPVISKKVSVEFAGLAEGEYQLTLIDANHKRYINSKISHHGGSLTQTISLPNLAPGVYHFVISNGYKQYRKAIVVE